MSNKKSIIIPLNIKVAILVTNIDEMEKDYFSYIEPEGNPKADINNKSLCRLEKEFGNRFIIGENKEVISPYIEYIKLL